MTVEQNDLKKHIRNVPDFPKTGVVFRDISPLLAEPDAFAHVLDRMFALWKGDFDVVAAFDARGFVFASHLAYNSFAPLVMIRKKGKLPPPTISASYSLEYRDADMLELPMNIIQPGQRVLLIDDVLATGGTAACGAKLVELAGGIVAGFHFVIELAGLKGYKQISKYAMQAEVVYE